MRFFLRSAFALGCIGSLFAASVSPPEVEGLELEPNGTFTFDQVSAFAGYYCPGWSQRLDQGGFRPVATYPKNIADAWTTQVSFSAKDQSEPLTLDERLSFIDSQTFVAGYRASHPSGLPMEELFLQLEIPVAIAAGKPVIIDGSAATLPITFTDPAVFTGLNAEPHTLVVPGASGTVTIKGVFGVVVQDQRKWKKDSYAVRLRFSPATTLLTRAALDVTFHHTPYQSTPLSIREIATFGFADEVAGDGKGGWTDQGAENDLRALPPGPLKAAGVAFDIIDSATNDKRSALVLGRNTQPFLPKTATLSLNNIPEAGAWRNLYLLHASGWTPPAGQAIGRAILRRADGTQVTRDVVSGVDVGNWWAPAVLPAAAVGWTGQNSLSGIGLYVSKISLGDQPVSEVTFESTGAAMWLIAAISGSADDIVPFAPPAPFVTAVNREWMPYKHEIDIVAGSVFDFSNRLDAPAGKYGPLVVSSSGHFAFAKQPDVRARFWGVNLCFGANYLDKDVADRLAERLARSGYNTVRIHHYDSGLQVKGGDSAAIDPLQVDRLDYLFAALKKRGIYVNIDLYTFRHFTPAELYALGLTKSPDASSEGGTHWRFKAVMPVSDLAFNLWAKFARDFLTHRNPYTDLTWGEDPALIGICPVNENPPSGLIENDPFIGKIYQKAFAAWRADPANRGAADEEEKLAFNRFAYEALIKLDTRLRDYIRGLGVGTLLSGANCANSQGLAYVRQHYDYVDNHDYWDHPSFPQEPFKFPFQFQQNSAIRFYAQVPRAMMPTRVPGKPFTVTEFNFVHPNAYRSEGYALMPAYAGLQDWDALYNFDYATSAGNIIEAGIGGGTFSIAGDPVGQIGDRVAATLFLRGDIMPAKGQLGFAVQPRTSLSVLQKSFPAAFSKLGLVTQIGSVPSDPASLLNDRDFNAVVVDPADYRPGAGSRVYAASDTLAEELMRDGALPAGSVFADGKRYRSDTGQIELRVDEGSFKLVTPRSELFVLPAQVSLGGDCVSVVNGEIFGTLSVLSVDDLPIAQSARLLVTYLTDALPSGVRFQSADRKRQENVGKLPHLVRRGTAELTLQLASSATYKAWAVSSGGTRLREIPLVKTSQGWRLQVQTVSAEGTQLAYEIQRQ